MKFRYKKNCNEDVFKYFREQIVDKNQKNIIANNTGPS